MKRLMQIIAISVLVLAAALAQAKTYTVKQGDCTSVIAARHHIKLKDLMAVNKQIKNPGKIYQGQKLQIPTKIKKQKIIIIRTLGFKPFGRQRDTVKAIKKSKKLPKVVKELLIAEYKSGNFSWSSLKKGDRREEMFYGDYKILTNVVMDFPEGHHEAARRYSVEWQGEIYHLDIPLKCYNPTWSFESLPQLEPEPEPAPAPTLEPQTQPQHEPPAPEPESTTKEYPAQYESYVWAGHYWALEGGGQSSYYGGKLNIFPFTQETSWGRLREGIGATINGWDGDNHGFNFRGNRWTLGPVASLTGQRTGTKFTTTVQLGQQKDRGYNGLGYRSRQKTKILYFGESLDLYKVGPFYKVESWLDANFDIGHDKNSSFRGNSISGSNDPVENKTVLGFGNRFYFWKTDYLHGGAKVNLDYAVGDHSVGMEVGPFIADNGDIMKAGLTFRNQSNSKFDDNNGNSIGVGFDLDIEKTIRSIIGYVKTKKGGKKEKLD